MVDSNCQPVAEGLIVASKRAMSTLRKLLLDEAQSAVEEILPEDELLHDIEDWLF